MIKKDIKHSSNRSCIANMMAMPVWLCLKRRRRS